jgi:hypothetical protein
VVESDEAVDNGAEGAPEDEVAARLTKKKLPPVSGREDLRKQGMAVIDVMDAAKNENRVKIPSARRQRRVAANQHDVWFGGVVCQTGLEHVLRYIDADGALGPVPTLQRLAAATADLGDRADCRRATTCSSARSR